MKVYTNRLIFKRKIKKIFDLALKECEIKEDVAVNVFFVSEKEIRRLNKEHRDIDKITDVLSFPMLEIKPGDNLENFKDDLFKEIFLGDIAICTNRAKQQAKEYGHSFKREVCFLALHGLLHLLGYDHIKKQDETKMMSLAETILKKSGIRRNKWNIDVDMWVL